MRIATIDKEKCHSDKCQKECINFCPINRKGDRCVYLGEDKNARIEEDICIGCGLCVKKCPYKTIEVVNTPEQLKEEPIHRFGENQFVLFRLPFPTKNEVVGLLGPNGMGKTTALRILSGETKPNMGKTQDTELSELIKIFRGTDLQSHLEALKDGKMTAVIKPQQVDILTKVDKTVSELLSEHDERGVKDDVIKKLQLDACIDRKLAQLSGGELQRVAIAIAFSRKADIYYIDEPSSYLDVFQRLEVAKLIRELSKEASVMVVEHDLATLDFLADKIHVFYGVPGTYGIVSKPQSTRVGINQFLDGYIKE
ncbi:MAG: ATP-binding cassette domain-containing protein, partial [Candidatus Aenigmarchaeota archaeon]|nr:ATP-binding cassette domain-containing protein [Candidatus Aenigmarchaeota archaeon]